MSDHEFERYLAILCGVLRITPSRREEIAAELRDHLEERLTESLDKGMSRDKAIVTALEEFGDAAGLAAEFLHIMRKQRRRWYMKATMTGVLASVVLFVTAMAMWPEDAPVRGTHVIAQDQAAAETPPAIPGEEGGLSGSTLTPFDEGAPPPTTAKKGKRQRDAQPKPSASTLEENNTATEQKLSQRIAATYPQTPLIDVLTDVAKECDFEFILNHRQIAESETALDMPVDLNLKSIRADMLLDLVLRDAGLVYTIRDGIVVVTTQNDMASTMEVRVYNCRDLVGLSSYPGSTGMGGDMMGMGMGEGAMGGAMGGAGMMGGGGAPGMPPGGAMGGAPGGMGMAMPGMGAGGGGFAAGGMGGPGGGMGMAMPGMSRMPGMPGMPGMGAVEQGMPGGDSIPPGSGMGGPSSSHYIPNMNALIAVLTNTVAQDTWAVYGGSGSIEPYYGGLLIVNNNPQAHEKIEKLLKMMRLAATQQPGSMVRDK